MTRTDSVGHDSIENIEIQLGHLGLGIQGDELPGLET